MAVHDNDEIAKVIAAADPGIKTPWPFLKQEKRYRYRQMANAVAEYLRSKHEKVLYGASE